MTQDPAAIWLRVSTPDQEVANQEPALREEAARRGLSVVKTYSVKGRSAYSGAGGKVAAHRGDIERVLADARRGLFRFLLIWALDRLSREGVEKSLRLVRMFEEQGVTVVSIQEPWLEQTSDERDLLIAVTSHTANSESKRRGERIKARRYRLLGQNRFPGGRPPFVYRVDEDGTLVAIPERQKIAELVIRLYSEERLGDDLIIRELRDRRIKSPNGKAVWSYNAVDGILLESAYAYGVYLYQYERDGARFEARIPAQAFIDPAVFERVQRLREANRMLRHSADGTVKPLTMMTCIECGSHFLTESGPNRPRTYFDAGRARNSRHALETGSRCLAIPRLKAEIIEPLMYEALLDVMATPRVFVEKAVAPRRAELQEWLAELDDEHENLDAQEAKLRQRKTRLAEGWVQGDIPEDKIAAMRAELEEEESCLAEKRAAADPERLRKLDEARAELEALDLGAGDWERIARWRDDNGLRMDRFSIHPACAESDELVALRDSGLLPVRVDRDELPRMLGEWLSRLQADLVAHPDHITVDGMIEFEVKIGGDENASRQASHSKRGLR